MAKPRSLTARPPKAAATQRPTAAPARNLAIVGTEELGLRMRKMRMERRMTLKQVERAADLSATHLSEIERGRTSPTIGALVRIARALGRDASYFIERDERSDVAHTPRDRAAKLQISPGVVATVLTDGIPGSQLFAYRLTLTPGPGRHGEFQLPVSEDLDAQALYLVRHGKVSSRFGEHVVELNPGDGAQANRSQAHMIRPASQEPVELIGLFTRPIDGGL